MASTTATLRKDLSAPGLIATVRKQFMTIKDSRRQASVLHSLPDTLCAALALFQFKFPSLLQFDQACRTDSIRARNLRRLYSLDSVACDTELREILDPIKPSELRGAFRAVHSSAQRGKMMEDFAFFDNKLLLSIDGTGQFSSTRIGCPHCAVKTNRAGQTTFYHQLLAAAIVHPDHKTALPLDFEPIIRADGNTKNDCERNAGKRLIESIHQHYSKRDFIVLEDALGANGPHIQTLKNHGMDFIINIKPAGNKYLFELIHERFKSNEVTESEQLLDDGTRRGYRLCTDLPINASHPDIRVNMVEYWVVDKKGKTTNFSWVTNLDVGADSVHKIARAGRTRWKIENELFNCLKNNGYQLEHNFGHGTQYLSSTLAGLMLLAFLTDQVQNHACRLYKAARAKSATLKTLWASMQTLIDLLDIPDWATLWKIISRPDGQPAMLALVDSS